MNDKALRKNWEGRKKLYNSRKAIVSDSEEKALYIQSFVEDQSPFVKQLSNMIQVECLCRKF